MSVFICSACGCVTEDPDVVTEDEVLQGDAAGMFDSEEELADALEGVGAITCPDCHSSEITEIGG